MVLLAAKLSIPALGSGMKGYEVKFFRRGIPFVLNTPELREGVIIGGDKNLTYYGDITENSNAI